jgi:microcystin-dependent protein
MSEPFLGQITLYGFNFAPYGWVPCNGQLLPVSQYGGLFSLLGTAFGGNGTTTFGLPNLQGTVPVGQGTSSIGTTYTVGETGGSESVTLNNTTVPPHTHTISAAKATADKNTLAANLVPADGTAGGHGRGHAVNIYALPTAGTQVPLASSAIPTAGGNIPHENMQPTLAANWCISLSGVFPTRG